MLIEINNKSFVQTSNITYIVGHADGTYKIHFTVNQAVLVSSEDMAIIIFAMKDVRLLPDGN